MLLSKLLVCHLPIEELGLMGRVNRARFHSKDDTNTSWLKHNECHSSDANTQPFEVLIQPKHFPPFTQLLYLWLAWQDGGLHHNWLSSAEMQSKDMFLSWLSAIEPSWHWGHTLVKWCMSVGWMEVGWGCTVSYELVADGGHSLASSSMARTCPFSQWAILCRGSACEKLFCPEQNTGKRTFQKTFAYSIMGQCV